MEHVKQYDQDHSLSGNGVLYPKQDQVQAPSPSYKIHSPIFGVQLILLRVAAGDVELYLPLDTAVRYMLVPYHMYVTLQYYDIP